MGKKEQEELAAVGPEPTAQQLAASNRRMPDGDQGPPAQHEFDTWAPERHEQFKNALDLMDKVKSFRDAKASGGIANADWAKYSDQLYARGGITPEEALNLGRYRVYRSGRADVPTERPAKDTPEIVQQRAKDYFASDAQGKKQLLRDAKSLNEQDEVGFYDSLTPPPKVERKSNEMDPVILQKAKALAKKVR